MLPAAQAQRFLSGAAFSSVASVRLHLGALDNLRNVALAVGDLPAAVQYFERAGALFATQDDRYGLALSRELQGGMAAGLGHTADARATYRNALRDDEAGVWEWV